MSKSIDVLEVIDEALSYVDSPTFSPSMVGELSSVRAVVAELIEALTWVRDNPDDNAYWLAKVDHALQKAGAG